MNFAINNYQLIWLQIYLSHTHWYMRILLNDGPYIISIKSVHYSSCFKTVFHLLNTCNRPPGSLISAYLQLRKKSCCTSQSIDKTSCRLYSHLNVNTHHFPANENDVYKILLRAGVSKIRCVNIYNRKLLYFCKINWSFTSILRQIAIYEKQLT